MYPSPLRRLAGAALLMAAAWQADPAAAQTTAYVVSGTVVDAASRRPLPGAAVTLRNTQYRTVTDAAGRYALSARVAAGSYTLQVSLVGRGSATRQVSLGGTPAVELEPVALSETAIELEGLVVTGTGAPTERREVGNTVATVSGEAVSEAPGATAVDQALQGKIAGALISENSGQPGGGVSIRLRGTSTIYGSAEPLIVIDGVLVDNTSEALVGLGANATRGNAALSNRLADVPPGDIERVEVLKGAAAAALYGSRANSGVIQIFTKRGRQGRPQVTFRTEATAANTNERLALNMVPIAGRGDSAASGGAIRVGTPIERFDYQDDIFRTGYGTSNQLSISGGTEGTTYYVSGNWQKENGVLRGSDYDRAGVRARLTQRLSSIFEVQANLAYVRSRTSYVPEGEQTQGLFTSVVFTPPYFNPAFSDALGRYPYNPVLGPNPFDIIENWRADSEVNRFIGSAQVTATPFSGLTLTYLLGVDDGRESNVYLQPPGSINLTFPGQIQNPVRAARKFNSDFTANHEWSVSPSLRLTTTAGGRYTADEFNTVRASASGIIPGGSTVIGASPTGSQGLTELRTLGGFLQERVSIDDRLYLTAGINVEGSSAFGADQRWQAFPRFGASYLASDEGWFDRSLGGVFSTLRFRAAYGQTGGQPPSEYLNQNTYLNAPFTGKPGVRPNTLQPNPDLKPERQREWEGGFEAGFLRDRASVEFTYYDKETTDLVLSVPLAPTSGFASRWENIGVLSNKGVELTLNTVNLQGSRLGWTSRLTFARNRNEIERLNAANDTIVFDYLNAVIEGEPIGVFVGGYYPRDADGNIVYDAAGRPRRARACLRAACPTNNDSTVLRRVIGDPNPDFTAALQNSFTVGDNMEVSVLLDGRFGNDVANFTRRTSDFFGASSNAGLEATGDTIAGTFTRNTERNLLYEEFIEDGSFVKLREIALSYRFAQPWVRRATGAESISVRVAGRNLYTWTDYSGLDPEVNLFSASTVSRGVEFATTPIPRTFSVGLNVNF